VIAFAGATMMHTAATATDFYRGKSIDLIVGGASGGGADIYGRIVARHLGRNIPGIPKIIVKNMPGAGSAKAGYHVSKVAPPDGLTLAAIFSSAVIGPLLNDKLDRSFDPANIIYTNPQ
jgi:tripartite-type tricarboxylate transporter receptor subunit TctC